MHAVGRASDNEPAMVSLEWRGNPESDEYVSLVGKGVCFDAGGLNLKPTTSIGGMHNDKHGACSVLSAIKSVAHLGLKVNVVATIGLVENFISANSYRPLDIIQSRKGLTVEIGNTDAEGRLVLADCMNWVQENYLGKVKTMIDMATLTGACVIALGKNRAGVFTNSDHLAKQLDESGTEIEELVWRLPLDEYHDELIKSKQADITNASRRPEASSGLPSEICRERSVLGPHRHRGDGRFRQLLNGLRRQTAAALPVQNLPSKGFQNTVIANLSMNDNHADHLLASLTDRKKLCRWLA
jgi:leucyl aminopeptidase